MPRQLAGLSLHRRLTYVKCSTIIDEVLMDLHDSLDHVYCTNCALLMNDILACPLVLRLVDCFNWLEKA